MEETEAVNIYDWSTDPGYTHNQLAEYRKDKIVRNVRRIGVGILLSFTGMLGVGEVYAGDPTYIPHYAEALLTEHDCGSTPIHDRNIVQSELDTPNPEAEQLLLRSAGTQEGEAYREYANEKAKENGLTLVDDTPFQEKLQLAKTPDEVLHTLNNFGRNYGFGFELLDSHMDMLLRPLTEQQGSNDLPIERAKIDLNGFKYGARAFMRTLHFIPIQVIQTSKLETIQLVGALNSENGPVAGEAYNSNHTIAFTMGDFSSGDETLYTHEIGHRLDFELCGMFGSWKDSEYTDLNPKHFHYERNSNRPSNATASQYGRTNVYEDKATMYQYMLAQLNPSLFNNYTKTISEKYRLLLARLEEAVPGYSKYLSAISPRYPLNGDALSGR